VLYNAVNISQFRRQVEPQESQVCSVNFSNRPQSCAK